jgi:hypothetical protein
MSGSEYSFETADVENGCYQVIINKKMALPLMIMH